ncbi:MAG: LTA synthase family protein [Bacteroidetes bacterium]|nr:LTA synthase family protein [Bacteroidota bacterium]
MTNKSNFLLLLQRIFILMLLFTISRFLFLIINFSYFHEAPKIDLVLSFFFGLRFDITAIVLCNLLFIFLHFFPFSFFYSKWYQRITAFVFYLVNIPLLLLNCIDLVLFRFAGKRATADVFKIMSFGEDFTNAVPKMILDFWYLALLFVLLVAFLVFCYKKVKLQTASGNSINNFFFRPWIKPLSYLVFAFLVFTGFRGGLQYRPINILTASQYGSGKITALVLNTPFSVIKSYGKGTLLEMHYFSAEEVEQISPVIHNPTPAVDFRSLNVVVIILESFGKEYIGNLNKKTGYTPFLDSLMDQSLVFENAYANGKRSIEGIPAILSGIPALMQEPYITSAYAGNTVTSLASNLNDKGYTTEFFHGGTNGTMGFDNFVKMSGFKRYFGRKEYNNDADFDGSWGIYDEPFLHRVVNECSRMKQPFLSAVFTISSHHPYKIPAALEHGFAKGSLPIHQSIRYADYSLRKFFEAASTQTWYQNTLFVITADHTALSEEQFYQNRVGMYAIPLLFFRPDGSLKGRSMRTTQQIDILPSVMDYLNYDKSYFAFGSSVFDSSSTGFAINFINENYQLIEGNYSLVLDTLSENKLYNFTADSSLSTNRITSDTVIGLQMQQKLKAIIQQFNHAMVMNKMDALKSGK